MNQENLISANDPEIRIAIAGMGKMGGYHYTALKQLAAGECEDYYIAGIGRELAKIRVVGICDTNISQLENYNDVEKFASAEEMLDKTRPQILIIATPTVTHKQISLAAISRRIHTFVEKPIVTSTADMDELVTAAATANVRIMAGHIERYNPVSIKIKSLLGNVTPLPTEYLFSRVQKHPARISDDIVIDKLIHDLDLAICFFGDVKNIHIADAKRVDDKVYELKVNLKHKQGTKGTCFVSWLTTREDKQRQIEIVQGGHRWKGDFLSKKLWVDSIEIKCEVDGMIKPANNQIKDELVDFIASCMDISTSQTIVPLLSLEEIIESTKWLEITSKQV